ncbi:MAG TPA: hypothetical protein VH062_02785 [Polyangiaceae bacterium]|nr:hypothetical protein [Polyangiaceae bacterium]
MKVFLSEHVVPLFGVVFAIAILTLAIFEVPPVEPAAVFGLRVAASAEPLALTPVERAHVDDTLTRVLRTLDDGRRATEARPAAQTPQAAPNIVAPKPVSALAVAPALAPPATPTPASDPKLLGAVSALGDAVRAIHEARTEDDLLHAEDLVRTAREQMESNCATSNGPLCASAEQIKSLGY